MQGIDVPDDIVLRFHETRENKRDSPLENRLLWADVVADDLRSGVEGVGPENLAQGVRIVRVTHVERVRAEVITEEVVIFDLQVRTP
ncbi:hypothetical protein D8S78_06645 [Natrialba swarupiae]|nr:hypothetical protein [Natrialba swarupiae]